jgi:hypothetical protein
MRSELYPIIILLDIIININCFCTTITGTIGSLPTSDLYSETIYSAQVHADGSSFPTSVQIPVDKNSNQFRLKNAYADDVSQQERASGEVGEGMLDLQA